MSYRPFTFEVLENGKRIDGMAIVDPFISTYIEVKGLRAAWRVLFSGLALAVRVSADSETIEKVLELNPDYLGAQGSERRRAWNFQLNDALSRFADQVGESER